MKKTIFTLSIAIATGIATLNAQVTSGLVAKYSFNNANANDEIGTNNGLVSGASLTTDRFGNANKAYSFDGIDDYISFGDTPQFQMGNNDFCISLWVHYTTAQQAVILSKRAGAATNFNMYSISVMNDPQFGGVSEKTVAFLRSSNSNDRAMDAGIQSGGWHHLVLFHDYSDSTSLIIDGQVISTSVNTITGVFDIIGEPLVLAFAEEANSSFFNGKIDDLRIYNRLLSPLEIDSLLNEANPMTTGISDNSPINNTIAVFPNPTKNVINFSAQTNMQLTNLSGQIVADRKNVKTIDLSDQPKGIYFLILTDNNGQETQRSKIIKE